MKQLLLILLAILMLFAAGCKSEPEANSSGSSAPESSAPESSEVSEPDPQRPPVPEEESYELLPEEEKPLEERICGEWYADYAGLLISLKLSGDGSYTFDNPGEETQKGKWKIMDGLLVLDNKADDALLPIGNVLRWEEEDLLFTREKPELYAPAGVKTDAKQGDFDGYWKARFVAVGDGVILAHITGENAEIYIEGLKAALGGNRFGEIVRDLKAGTGALTLEENGVKVTLQLQEDDFLRMTVEGGENPAVIILARSTIPGEESEASSGAASAQ